VYGSLVSRIVLARSPLPLQLGALRAQFGVGAEPPPLGHAGADRFRGRVMPFLSHLLCFATTLDVGGVADIDLLTVSPQLFHCPAHVHAP